MACFQKLWGKNVRQRFTFQSTLLLVACDYCFNNVRRLPMIIFCQLTHGHKIQCFNYMYTGIEVLHGCHVTWQEQCKTWKEWRIYCSCHAKPVYGIYIGSSRIVLRCRCNMVIIICWLFPTEVNFYYFKINSHFTFQYLKFCVVQFVGKWHVVGWVKQSNSIVFGIFLIKAI